MAIPNLSEIITTTLRNRSGKLADQISRNNALLNRLSEKGQVDKIGGGRTIVRELEYAQNTTAMWYSGYQKLNIQPSQVFTAAEFNLRQAAVAVSISGLEMLQNDGEERVINLLKSRVKNAERTMENLIAAGVYSDGSNALQVGGLQFLVADTPTSGTVGGINRSTWEFWRNISKSANADYGAASTGGIGNGPFTAANIVPMWNDIYARLLRGREKPDLILTDNDGFNAYMGSLQNIQRVTQEKEASQGFLTLKYMGADVIADGGFQGYSTDVNPGVAGCPKDHVYFLNTDYLFWQPHRQCDMVPLSPGDRYSTNQDATVKLIGFAGNMTISNARMQAVLKP